MMRCCLILVLAVSSVAALPTGAPESTCETMTPRHGGNEPQSDETFPYKVTCKEIWPGRVKVKVTGGDFKGVLIQIRDTEKQRVGTTAFKGDDYQFSCNDTAITHLDNSVKNEAFVIYHLTKDEMVRDPSCVVTVVEQFDTFWVKHTVSLRKMRMMYGLRGYNVVPYTNRGSY